MDDINYLNYLMDSVKYNSENCRYCTEKKCLGCEVKVQYDKTCFEIIAVSDRLWN